MDYCSIWLILLFLQAVFTRSAAASPDGGGHGGMGNAVSVTLTSTSSITFTLPANGTATQSSIQPAITLPPPIITFPMLSNATTCMPVTFKWEVTPSSFNITNIDVRLLITNDKVLQAARSNTTTSMPVTSMQPIGQNFSHHVIFRCVTNKTALTSGSYNWAAVTVPEGWYILDISIVSDYLNDVTAHSAQFFVMTGSNTSCLHPNNVTFPAKSHTDLMPGALAGTVLGSVVGAAALVGAFVLPRLWRRGVPGHEAWKDNRGGLYKVF